MPVPSIDDEQALFTPDSPAKTGMVWAVTASTLLHVSAFGVPALLHAWRPSNPKAELLQVTLAGKVSTHQDDAQLDIPSFSPRQVAMPQRARPHHDNSAAPNPALPKMNGDGRAKPQAPSPPQPPQPAKVSEPAQAALSAVTDEVANTRDAQRQATTLDPRNRHADDIKPYLAGVKRKIQAHLQYPDEAKRNGYEGNPVVRFTITESGTIRSGSIAIALSCGIPALDANALKAVEASAPFEVPMKEMEVVIVVSFGLRD